MIKIPKELQKEDFRFVILQPQSKKPFEKNWTKENFYKYDDEKLLSYLKMDYNYGVMGGFGKLIILDVDELSIIEELEKIIPETFTVETGSGKRHYYFLSEQEEKVIFTKGDTHYGELQAKGAQCVGPSSIHPATRKPYEVLKNGPIASLEDKDLMRLIELYKDNDEEMKVEAPNWNLYSQVNFHNSMQVTSLVNMNKMKKTGHEYVGEHPIHGSTTGMNFWISPQKNLWHCFRCNSGGDALALASIIDKICNCSDFSIKGKKLRGKDFIDTIKNSQEKHGLKLTQEEQDKLFNRKKPIADTQISPERLFGIKEELETVLDSELDAMQIREPEWIVKDLILKDSFGFIGGKSNSFKTSLSLYLAYCIAEGKECFGKKVEKMKVLYMNEENSWNTFAPLAKMIRSGADLLASENLMFTTLQGLRLDTPQGIKKLEKVLLEFAPQIVFLDSFRRFISFEENNADRANDFHQAVIQYLRRKYAISICSIHHTRKETEDANGVAQLDSLRGSSEFANLSDYVHIIKRKPGKTWLEMTTVKMRGAKDGDKKTIALTFDEDEKHLVFNDLTKGEMASGEIRLNDCTNDVIKFLKERKIERFRAKDVESNLPLHGHRQLYDALKNLINDNALLRHVKGQYTVNKLHELFIDTDIENKIKDKEDETEDSDIQSLLE